MPLVGSITKPGSRLKSARDRRLVDSAAARPARGRRPIRLRRGSRVEADQLLVVEERPERRAAAGRRRAPAAGARCAPSRCAARRAASASLRRDRLRRHVGDRGAVADHDDAIGRVPSSSSNSEEIDQDGDARRGDVAQDRVDRGCACRCRRPWSARRGSGPCGSSSSHRAMMIFCCMPPEKLRRFGSAADRAAVRACHQLRRSSLPACRSRGRSPRCAPRWASRRFSRTERSGHDVLARADPRRRIRCRRGSPRPASADANGASFTANVAAGAGPEAEERLDRLGAPGTDQAAEPEDLAAMPDEKEMSRTIGGAREIARPDSTGSPRSATACSA